MKDIFKRIVENALIEADFDNDSGERFWGNKGAGVLPFCSSTKRFLINHRSGYVNEPHTWGVWGGAIDSNEQPRQAVLRELREEAGYTGHIELIDAYIFRSSGGGFTFYNFIGIVDEEFEPELDWESQGFEWIGYDDLLNKDNLHFGLESLLDNNRILFEDLDAGKYD